MIACVASFEAGSSKANLTSEIETQPQRMVQETPIKVFCKPEPDTNHESKQVLLLSSSLLIQAGPKAFTLYIMQYISYFLSEASTSEPESPVDTISDTYVPRHTRSFHSIWQGHVNLIQGRSRFIDFCGVKRML